MVSRQPLLIPVWHRDRDLLYANYKTALVLLVLYYHFYRNESRGEDGNVKNFTNDLGLGAPCVYHAHRLESTSGVGQGNYCNIIVSHIIYGIIDTICNSMRDGKLDGHPVVA